MRILILSVSTGQGHHRTAHAIEEHLIQNGTECKVVDIYKYINKFLSDAVEQGYLLSTKRVPKLYGEVYRQAEKKILKNKILPISKITNSILGQKLIKLITAYKPDVIVSTHVFAAILSNYVSKKIPSVKTIGIVTDFTLHPFWEDTNLDYYVTASPLLTHECVKKGKERSRILPFGIPVDKKFTSCIKKEDARELLGIENKTTIMIMMGSMGFGNICSILKEVDKVGLDFQVLCVCGNNKRALKRAENMETRHKVYTYGFVDNVDKMMDASNFIITKPGGLTISECMTKGLPFILMDPIPGQEERNKEFLLNNGIASFVSDTYPIDDAIYQLLSNEWKMENIESAVRYLGKPNASADLCNFILSLNE